LETFYLALRRSDQLHAELLAEIEELKNKANLLSPPI
jgi:hypothetical protein